MTLNVSDLSVARGGVRVLQGLSFSLDPGRALLLRGPNGIGKTTLLRTLAGLQPPLDGHIAGTEDRIAYAAHADGLKPTLSVTENLEFWAQVFGTRSIAPALAAYDLGDLSARLVGMLSAGQKRRLGLARLLVTGRPVWVLDEPTVSLDTGAIAMFTQSVRAHLGQGGSAVIATHVELDIKAEVLDVAAFRAVARTTSDFDDGFFGDVL